MCFWGPNWLPMLFQIMVWCQQAQCWLKYQSVSSDFAANEIFWIWFCNQTLYLKNGLWDPMKSCSTWSFNHQVSLPPLRVRLGSRISPHRNRVVVEVHWRGAQGWRSISWVVAAFNHVGGSFNLSMAATGDVWIIPSFRIWGYVLHVEHISCVITNCGQLQWAIPSLFSIAL